MITKFLEAFFRHKLLILLPSILIPLIVGPIAILTAPALYETSTGIWVERLTYIKATDEWNRNVTPNRDQAARLNELVQTRSFLTDIARRTSLAPLVGSPNGEEKIQKVLKDGLTVVPRGNRLLVLRVRAETPQLSLEVANALVEVFQEKLATDRGDQAGLAVSFYEGRLQAAEEKLNTANEAMRRYLARNPGPQASLRGTSPLSASQPDQSLVTVDPRLAEMQRRVELEQREVERAHSSLEQTRLTVAASIEGQELGFQVVDPPRPALAPSRELRKSLIFPAAGLLVGVGLSATLLVLLVAADRSVRAETDLATDVRVVGVVPCLQIKRISKQTGPDATRRAVGFVAGTALPTPGGVDR